MHEGGITIIRDSDGWVFSKPDGQPCESWVSDDNLARHLDFALRRRNTQAQHDRLDGVDSFQHPDARIIRPRWTGEVFDLHACVQARSPSNSPRTRSKISKRHSEVSGRHSATDNTSAIRTTPLAGRTTPLDNT